MRTVFLGTSEFAAAVLGRLAASPHAPALVVTRPDAPRGRGRQLAAPPVAEAARALGIEVVQPEQVNDAASVARIGDASPDAVVLCAFGALIREPLLSAFGPILNVHPSLLPRWRGAAPVERAIMAGDATTGVSIMALTAGLDDGPVAVAEAVAIAAGDDFATLSAKLEDVGSALLLRVLDEGPAFVAQPEDGVTYAEKIVTADRTLDPSRPAIELERVVRALRPHIGARVALDDGTMLGVRAARVDGDGSLAPGAVEGVDGRLLLGTAGGALELVEVQPPGGRPMAAADFLRGRAR